MVVVADAGPIHYLCLLEQELLLHTLYGLVIVPEQVRDELTRPETPALVRRFFQASPPWLNVQAGPGLQSRSALGMGELAAISLAVNHQADLLLCDDLTATRAARAAGLTTLGTLGILRDAALNGHIDLAVTLHRLRSTTNFRATPALIEQMLRDYESRR